MKEHLAMSSNRLDSFFKMKSEIVDIVRTKAAVSRPSPMEIDTIYKGKGKYDKYKVARARRARARTARARRRARRTPPRLTRTSFAIIEAGKDTARSTAGSG